MPCVYSRAGYRDPYEDFRWDRAPSFNLATDDERQHQTSTSEGHALFDGTAPGALLDENGHTITVASHSNSAVEDGTLHTETTQPVPGMFGMDDSNISYSLGLEESNAAQLGYQHHYSMDDSAFQWDERIDSVFFNAFGQFDPQIPVLEDNIVPEGMQG